MAAENTKNAASRICAAQSSVLVRRRGLASRIASRAAVTWAVGVIMAVSFLVCFIGSSLLPDTRATLVARTCGLGWWGWAGQFGDHIGRQQVRARGQHLTEFDEYAAGACSAWRRLRASGRASVRAGRRPDRYADSPCRAAMRLTVMYRLVRAERCRSARHGCGTGPVRSRPFHGGEPRRPGQQLHQHRDQHRGDQNLGLRLWFWPARVATAPRYCGSEHGGSSGSVDSLDGVGRSRCLASPPSRQQRD